MSNPFTGRPHAGVLVGITHTHEGSAIIRQPRVLKVGIGLPKGKAINVWIHKSGKWVIQTGYNKENSKVTNFDTMAAAQAAFPALYESAPICPYPRKTPYFTFTANTGGDGSFLPAWEAIEAHGPTPTVIPVVFTSDSPHAGPGTGYRMYSATELKCKGDGVNALRVLSMAETEEEKLAAAQAKSAGDKFFIIDQGCWTMGCKYAKSLIDQKGNEKRQCTPHMDLVFQAVKSVRLGNTAYYHTTGVASISNIFSSLNDIQAITGGRLVGIPMLLTVKQFKTNHNGKAGSAYMVLVEPTMEAARKLLEDLMRRPFGTKQLDAGGAMIDGDVMEAEGDDEEESPLGAEAIHAEFVDEEPAPVTDTVKEKTDNRTDDLAEKLKKQKEAKPEAARGTGNAANDQFNAAESVAAEPAGMPKNAVPESRRKGDLF